ncbi:MAG: hypothetical protein M3464_20855 [Chloroflexota bacterium]|nr:hypothetical protein [Chloroflexota bacterium]
MNTRRSNILSLVPDDLLLPNAALDQTVAWSTELRRAVSLREFIASRASEGVMRALAIAPEEAPPDPVKRVTEMTDEELRRTVIAIVRRNSEGGVLAVAGDGTYTVDELVHEVELGSELGNRFTAATARHINLLEDFVDSGGVKGMEKPLAEVDIELDF